MKSPQTSSPSARLLVGAAVVSVALVSTASAQTTLLEWDFTGPTGTNFVSLSAPWSAFSAPTVSDNLSDAVFTNTASNGPRARNYGGAGEGGVAGYLFLAAGQSGGTIHETMIVTTTFDALDLATDQLDSISWYQSVYAPSGGNASAVAMNVYLLVQVDGSWYASENPFKNPTNGAAGNMGTGGLTHTLELDGPSGLGTTAWRTISFADGSPVAVGASLVSTAIGTNISGIGFYVDFRGGTGSSAHDRRVFIDSIRITAAAIPEPSAAAALVGLGVLGSALGRRRRR